MTTIISKNSGNLRPMTPAYSIVYFPIIKNPNVQLPQVALSSLLYLVDYADNQADGKLGLINQIKGLGDHMGLNIPEETHPFDDLAAIRQRWDSSCDDFRGQEEWETRTITLLNTLEELLEWEPEGPAQVVRSIISRLLHDSLESAEKMADEAYEKAKNGDDLQTFVDKYEEQSNLEYEIERFLTWWDHSEYSQAELDVLKSVPVQEIHDFNKSMSYANDMTFVAIEAEEKFEEWFEDHEFDEDDLEDQENGAWNEQNASDAEEEETFSIGDRVFANRDITRSMLCYGDGEDEEHIWQDMRGDITELPSEENEMRVGVWWDMLADEFYVEPEWITLWK